MSNSKVDNTARIHSFRVRLNEQEYRLLAHRAEEFNTTKSDYIRGLISLPVSLTNNLESNNNDTPVLLIDDTTFPRLIKQIRHWGYHFDQALHALNIVASKRFMSAPETSRLVNKAIDTLEEINDAKEHIEKDIDMLLEKELLKMKRVEDVFNDHA